MDTTGLLWRRTERVVGGCPETCCRDCGYRLADADACPSCGDLAVVDVGPPIDWDSQYC